MMGRILVLAAVLVSAAFFVSAGQAASFDCSKASTSYEKAICDDPELSKLDEQMAEAYAAARDRVSGEGREAILSSQREWLNFAERACSPDAAPREGAYDEDGLFCLRNRLGNRIDDLKFDTSKGDLSFYPVQRYRAVEDTETEGWWQAAHKTLRYPVIAGEGDEATRLNDFVRRLVGNTVNDFDDYFTPDGYSDNDTNISVSEVTAERVTFEQLDYMYGHGAAHGNYAISYHHYLRKLARPMREIDIFSRADWPSVAVPAIEAALKQELGEDGYWRDSMTYADVMLPEIDRWVLSPEGISFQFQPYEVTAYAGGAPVALVPWPVLEGYLAEGALRIAGAE
jgi:uncharacterized protein YecT (DUF1311 family)